jgi:hypothetical protein
MDDCEPRTARRIQETPGRCDGPAQQRNVVAEHGAKAAGLEKISLHVVIKAQGGIFGWVASSEAVIAALPETGS